LLLNRSVYRFLLTLAIGSVGLFCEERERGRGRHIHTHTQRERERERDTHTHTHTHTSDVPKVDVNGNREDVKGAETEPASAVSVLLQEDVIKLRAQREVQAYIASSQEAGMLEHQVRGIKALVHHASGMPLLIGLFYSLVGLFPSLF
jgi:hypothetical protein